KTSFPVLGPGLQPHGTLILIVPGPWVEVARRPIPTGATMRLAALVPGVQAALRATEGKMCECMVEIPSCRGRVSLRRRFRDRLYPPRAAHSSRSRGQVSGFGLHAGRQGALAPRKRRWALLRAGPSHWERVHPDSLLRLVGQEVILSQ